MVSITLGLLWKIQAATTQLIWNGSGKFSLALHKKAEEVLAVVVTEQIRGLMK